MRRRVEPAAKSGLSRGFACQFCILCVKHRKGFKGSIPGGILMLRQFGAASQSLRISTRSWIWIHMRVSPYPQPTIPCSGITRERTSRFHDYFLHRRMIAGKLDGGFIFTHGRGRRARAQAGGNT